MSIVPWLALLAAPTASNATAPLARVAGLQGCWTATTPGRIVEEQWMSPRAGSMVGMSRTVRDDKVVATELMVLRAEGEHLVFEAHPAGQPVASFRARATATLEAGIVFENPTHDFPQRIGYRKDGDTLTAWIEGPIKGQTKRIEFPYRRTPCPSP